MLNPRPLTRIIRLSVLLATAVLPWPNSARTGETPTFPEETPRIEMSAAFTEHSRYAIFAPGESPVLAVKVTGWRQRADALQWEVRDYLDQVRAAGEVEVPPTVKDYQAIEHGRAKASAAPDEWVYDLTLGDYGAGYFEVHLNLKNNELSLPRAGSRPAGFVSYGVLPPITPLELNHPDESRFGAQGTNFLETGEWMKGSSFNPLYGLLGLKWTYRGRRMFELEGKQAGQFQPKADSAIWRKYADDFTNSGVIPIVDLHGVPGWLQAVPAGVAVPPPGTPGGQAYPPRDWAEYGDFIRRVAAEEKVRRETLCPAQARSYYQIHWEPDWHWKGSDAEFIKMYEVAHEAIQAGDPGGCLLGANYGVLAKGNELMRRLFAQGLGQYLDGIATHTYYIPEWQYPEEGNLVPQVRELVELTRKYLKPGAPIINTEWGSTYRGRSVHKFHDALRVKLGTFMRGHLIALGEGVDCTWFFYTADYDIHNGWGICYNLRYPNPSHGATHISPKPSAMAVAAVTRLLEGTKSLGALKGLDENVLAYGFRRGEELVLALWSADNQAREIMLPLGTAEAKLYDPMGNARPLAAEAGLAKIKVDDVPVYVGGLPLNLAGAIAGQPHEKLAELAGRPGTEVKLPAATGLTYRLFRAGQSQTAEVTDGRLTIPAGAAAGDWLLLAAGADGGLVEAAPLTVQPLVALQPETGPAGHFRLENLTAAPVSGDFGLEGRSATQALTLAAHEVQSLSVPPADLLIPGERHARPAFFRSQAGSLVRSAPSRETLVPVSAFATPPVIDGKLDEWPKEGFYTFDRLDSHLWRGPQDLTVRCSFRFDAAALYVAVWVRDDDHQQDKPVNQAWQEDSLQVGLAVGAGEKGWQSAQKLCFSLAGNEARARRDVPGLMPAQFAPDSVRCAITRTGDETFYELAIPWSETAPGQTGIPADRRVGIGLLVNDVDRQGGAPGPRKFLDAFGNGGVSYYAPEKFSVLCLLEN